MHISPHTENARSTETCDAHAATVLSAREARMGNEFWRCLSCQKARPIVTKLFIVADFCSVAIKFSIHLRCDSTGINTVSWDSALNVRYHASMEV